MNLATTRHLDSWFGVVKGTISDVGVFSTRWNGLPQEGDGDPGAVARLLETLSSRPGRQQTRWVLPAAPGPSEAKQVSGPATVTLDLSEVDGQLWAEWLRPPCSG